MYISRFVGNVKQKGELDVLEGVTAILREFSKMEEHLIKTSWDSTQADKKLCSLDAEILCIVQLDTDRLQSSFRKKKPKKHQTGLCVLVDTLKMSAFKVNAQWSALRKNYTQKFKISDHGCLISNNQTTFAVLCSVLGHQKDGHTGVQMISSGWLEGWSTWCRRWILEIWVSACKNRQEDLVAVLSYRRSAYRVWLFLEMQRERMKGRKGNCV